MNYFSDISHGEVSEAEALKQIIDFCDEWQQLSRRSQRLSLYFRQHPELLEIEAWGFFKKIKRHI
jgi:hypothetical protein